MIPIDQTKLHIEGKQNGNCMNAAFASLLELDIENIPHFEDMDDLKWYPSLLDWLESIGFHLMTFDHEFYPPCFFIANGLSPRGVEHSVVYKGVEMVHDPHPSRSGIDVSSVWILVPLDPAKYNDGR